MIHTGVFEDWNKAKQWFYKGVEKGNPFAQMMLGSYYALQGDSFENPVYFFNADGISDTEKIERNFAEGFKWLRLAADQNIDSAQGLFVKIYCDADCLGNEHLEEAKLWCEFYEKPE
ncbi:hypothetical protein N9C56_07755 [Paracoccaceae bacterium]|nr:hypothetical protein [Paracoccaceae bacterium]